MIDLTKFCSTDPDRPYLHKPFSQGVHTIATNGHIMVYVPRIVEVLEQKKPNCLRYIDKFDDKKPMSARFPKLPTVQTTKPCLDCYDGKEHDCPSCKCFCRTCGGLMQVPMKQSVLIGNAIFDVKYIKLLKELPNCLIEKNPSISEAMQFVFDGGRGVLMPMSREYEDHFGKKQKKS